MNDNDLLDLNEGSYDHGAHSGARTLMIIMTVLWSILLIIDLFFLTIFSFVFSIANAVETTQSMPLAVSILFWNFAAYPVSFVAALVGGYSSLSKRNYSSVYIFGLLPLIHIVVFFLAIFMIPD